MLDPDRFDPAAHVAAAAPAVGLALDAARQARVAAAFALVVRIAAPALAVPLTEADEPAPVYRP
ncbi:AtzG-like protein [Belnapia sp. F-4-1]|uniref:AtzG-like protein n=1 Tax=Belnapia sp. F-4-1 TaxID=1545443 RepID=UPI0005BA1689|nr:AtzG-like protein [Belnapia sp. F-4-1]